MKRARQLVEYHYGIETRTKETSILEDFWGSKLDQNLRERGLFGTDTDLGFLFSTDGIKVYKSRVEFHTWPIMLVNLSLPPSERFKRRNCLFMGSIPGPDDPKDLNSFLVPLIEELRQLQEGIPGVWNAYRKEYFTLKAHICVIGSDIPARETLMQTLGRESYQYCTYYKVTSCRGNKYIYCPFRVPDDVALEIPDATLEEAVDFSKDAIPAEDGEFPTWDFRTHDEYLNAMEQIVKYNNYNGAYPYGVKGFSILTQLSSIIFPWSFPPDPMHLWFENIFPKTLFDHQRGRYFTSGILHSGKEEDEDDAETLRDEGEDASNEESSSDEEEEIQYPQSQQARSAK